MITDVRTGPVRYQPGTTLDTSLPFRLIGNEMIQEGYMGTSLTIPEKMKKVFVTEQLGPVVIERVAIQLRQDEIIPIYMKIYEPSGNMYVLVYLPGVHEIVSQSNNDDVPSTFARQFTFNSLSYMEDAFAYYQLVPTDIPIYYNAINELPNPFLRWHQIPELAFAWTDLQWEPLGQSSDGVWQIALRHLTNMDMDIDGSHSSEFMTERPSIELALEPKLGPAYDKMAYDPWTRKILNDVVMDPKIWLRSYLSGPKHHDTTELLVADKLQSSRELVTDYRDWLGLVNWFVQLPVVEVVLLFNWNDSNTKSQLEIKQMVYKKNCEPCTEYWLQELRDVLYPLVPKRARNGKVLFVKNSIDELFVDFYGEKERRRFYLDLSLFVILNRGIIRTAKVTDVA